MDVGSSLEITQNPCFASLRGRIYVYTGSDWMRKSGGPVGLESCKIVERTPEALGKALAEALISRARSNGYPNAMQFSLEAIAKCVASAY